jgi:hypothetical protein
VARQDPETCGKRVAREVGVAISVRPCVGVGSFRPARSRWTARPCVELRLGVGAATHAGGVCASKPGFEDAATDMQPGAWQTDEPGRTPDDARRYATDLLRPAMAAASATDTNGRSSGSWMVCRQPPLTVAVAGARWPSPSRRRPALTNGYRHVRPTNRGRCATSALSGRYFRLSRPDSAHVAECRHALARRCP